MNSIVRDYKKCTNNFINWVINLSKTVSKTSSNLTHSLTNLLIRVEIISNIHYDELVRICDGSDFDQQFVQMIEDIETAIYLRYKVHLIYKELFIQSNHYDYINTNNTELVIDMNDIIDNNKKHHYCIQILKKCKHILIRWCERIRLEAKDVHSDTAEKMNSDSKKENIINIFSQLSIDDDDDESEADHLINDIIETAEAAYDNITIHDIDTSLDMVFNSQRLVIFSFLLQISDILHRVQGSWDRLAKEEISIISAVAVTTIALRTIDSLYAQLELSIDGISSSHEFLNIYVGKFLSTLEGKISGSKDGKISNQLLDIYHSMQQMHRILMTFSNHQLKALRDEQDVIRFDRNLNKDATVLVEFESLLPIDHEPSLCNFFQAELSSLRNYFQADLLGSPEDDDKICASHPCMKDFNYPFIKFFRSKVPSMNVLIRCMIWLSSIKALQNRTTLSLGRHIYMARKYTRKYQEMLRDIPPELMRQFPDFATTYDASTDLLITPDEMYPIYHHNPILAGALLTDILSFTSYSSGLFYFSNQVCHLYNALKQEGYIIGSIPFLDVHIKEFGDHIFANGQLPMCGKYCSSSLLKANYSASSIALLRNKSTLDTRNRIRIKSKKDISAQNQRLSATSGILKERKSSDLFSKSLNFSNLLDKVEALVQYELFNTRILSLHSMKNIRYFYESLLQIGKAIPSWHDWSLRMMETMDIEGKMKHSKSYHKYALAMVTHFEQLFKQLDTDSSLRTSQESATLQLVGGAIFEYFKNIDRMSDGYVLPVDCKCIEEEFGGMELPFNFDPADQFNMIHAQVFMQLHTKLSDMITMPNSLVAARKKEIIKEIKEIGVFNPIALKFINSASNFPTLLDFFICCSPVADMDMAEWLIQMNAFYIRGRNTLTPVLGGNASSSKSSLQLACQHKVRWGIELMLEATQGKDIVFQSLNDGNSALHYCYQAGDITNVHLFHTYLGPCPYIRTNDAGVLPNQIIVNDEMRRLVDSSSFRRMEYAEYEEVLNNSRIQTEQQINAEENNQRRKDKKLRKKQKNKPAEMLFTKDDEERADKAMQELLEEEAALSAKDPQHGRGSMKNDKKKKKKK